MFKSSRVLLAASKACARMPTLPVMRPVAISRVQAIRPVFRPTILNSVRFYTPHRSLDHNAKEVTYKEVKELATKPNPNIVIVDVREPNEFEEGHIPNAINIPYKTMPGALGLDAAEFEQHFGFPKPSQDKTLLFYCRSGVRSSGSEQLAHTYGYENRLNYKGSYLDWSTQENGGTAPEAPESKL